LQTVTLELVGYTTHIILCAKCHQAFCYQQGVKSLPTDASRTEICGLSQDFTVQIGMKWRIATIQTENTGVKATPLTHIQCHG